MNLDEARVQMRKLREDRKKWKNELKEWEHTRRKELQKLTFGEKLEELKRISQSELSI